MSLTRLGCTVLGAGWVHGGWNWAVLPNRSHQMRERREAWGRTEGSFSITDRGLKLGKEEDEDARITEAS